MKALLKTERLPGHIALADVPTPKPGPGEVLVRVTAASVCGSDLHAFHYDASYHFMAVPVILGHEVTGIVESTGEGAARFRRGDRVVAEAIHYCGTCSCCRLGRFHICEQFQVMGLHKNGGFAEFFIIPEQFVHSVPDELDPTIACLVEPLSIAVHAVKHRTRITPGDRVGIFGPGAIGLFTAQVVRTYGGIPVLFGVKQDETARLPLARQMGIETITLPAQNSEDVPAPFAGAFETILDCSGSHAAVRTALRYIKKGGHLVLVGLFKQDVSLPLSTVVRHELTIAGSYSSTSADYEKAIQLLIRGDVRTEGMVAAYAFDDFEQAFNDAAAQLVMKPILHM
jgi:L-iditol 2-dehydrogenase